MKYIRKFDSHKAYTAAYTELKDLSHYVTLYADSCGHPIDNANATNKVMFSHKSNKAWAGDLLCWDTIAKDWEIVHVNLSSDTLTLGDNLIPDAVCVVPACHTEDGKARWCALNDVKNDALKANEYQGKHYFRWGTSTLIEELSLYPVGPQPVYESDYSDCSNSEINDWVSKPTIAVELSPNDSTHNELNPSERKDHVLIGSWAQNIKDPVSDTSLRINSRYMSNGCSFWTYEGDGVTRNDVAFTFNNAQNEKNMFCDLSGFENTQILLKHSPNGTEYPAALAASLYEQTYSPAGSWYLPAAGEFAYLVARWYTIQHTLYILQQLSAGKGWSASPLDCNDDYWSSTQCSADGAVRLNTFNGSLYWNSKNYYYYVRPFRSF